MDPRSTLIEKGTHNGWTLFKHEGIPGLRFPHRTYWVAIKDGNKVTADTRKKVIADADAQDAITPEMRAHAARIASMLTNN